MPDRRLVIRASHIVAYQDGGHRYLRDGVIVIEGNTIAHVGRQYTGEADEIIDASRKLVTPGLISCHAHLAGSPLDKSFIEDVGPRNFYMSGLFEMLPTRAAAQDADSTQACRRCMLPSSPFSQLPASVPPFLLVSSQGA